jgi:hypothetical protein
MSRLGLADAPKAFTEILQKIGHRWIEIYLQPQSTTPPTQEHGEPEIPTTQKLEHLWGTTELSESYQAGQQQLQ